MKEKFVFKRRNILDHQHRDWHGDVRYIQIGRDAVGTLWLYDVTDDSRKVPLPATFESVGVDLGTGIQSLSMHTGEKIQHPQPLKHSLSVAEKTQTMPGSRKVKGSRNWWRAVRELAGTVP